VIKDHINLMGETPLVGETDEELGPRYPDLFDCYTPELRQLAAKAAKECGLDLKEGVYASVVGPNLESPAEYKYLRTIGADLVGMSTVPEVIVAAQRGMKILGISVVTDACHPESIEAANIDKIIAVANETAPKLTALIEKTVELL
jgi:purine-nucleoside phosphorylase